jgi:tartrate-resistant acid phosphatase type 5
MRFVGPRAGLCALIAVLALAGCNRSAPQNSASGALRAADGRVQFVAFGDAGTGSANQIAVGEAMAELCAARGCDFALELGDNFYASGVTSSDDAQFQAKFEIPYQNLKVPVFLTLGNHDNSRGPGEGSENARGDYQVDYHYLAGRTSDKWNLPARYYSFTAPLGAAAPLAEFFSLDSNPLTAIVADPNPEWNYLTYGAAQQEWLAQKMKDSKAAWKIAFAHHPYLSNGAHGNAGTYEGQPAGTPGTTAGGPWKQLLDQTVCALGADLMLAGHDHELEWHKPVASCGKTHHFVSGAADTPRPFGNAQRNPTYWQQDLKLGFWWYQLEADRFTAAAYVLDDENRLPRDAAGQPVAAFEQTLPKP